METKNDKQRESQSQYLRSLRRGEYAMIVLGAGMLLLSLWALLRFGDQGTRIAYSAPISGLGLMLFPYFARRYLTKAAKKRSLTFEQSMIEGYYRQRAPATPKTRFIASTGLLVVGITAKFIDQKFFEQHLRMIRILSPGLIFFGLLGLAFLYSDNRKKAP